MDPAGGGPGVGERGEARDIGRRIGTVAALVTLAPLAGLVWIGSLVEAARTKEVLLASLVSAGALFAATVARWTGALLGGVIERRRGRGATACGAVGALAVLAATAGFAALTGMLFGALEEHGAQLATRSHEFAWSYAIKPAAAVVLYGWPVAVVAGALAARAIRRRVAALHKGAVPPASSLSSPPPRPETHGLRLCVFGASGGCGGHLVRRAAERGHAVTAVVRAATPYVAPPGVRVVRGDVLDRAFVASVVGGHDAIVSCLGMRYRHPWARRESPDDFTSRATANIVAAAQAAGIRRLSMISAAGVGDSRPALNLPMRALLAISNVGVAYADLERAEQIVRATSLDWQIVRPATLTDRPGSGRVRRIDVFGVTTAIAREDVAAFMLDQIERETFDDRIPMIAA